ncbi:hypothetical protein D8674_007615 [Pyrus ussuriensis x Pyrus communis]|uniref:Integrase catalytic domain-containing protein n=1 Tax=Pyrus ussuriensis x Pyrus communis TaxID=2448454 RepID=A0A5N5HQF7_9ROSA|nr:hypothetical protein D8674_007615 [Pyrus ussuriensis x Pyrus communis]
MEYVIGCRTAYEAWTNLVDRYATVSKSRINHLKTELHTIQKGSDTIDKYLLRLKHIREQLSAAGESISDNDVMIAGLAGLPREYGVIRTVILARESTLTLKEFRALLLGTEREIEGEMNTLTQNLSALYVQGLSFGSNTDSGSSASSSNSHIQHPFYSLPPPQFPNDSFGYGFSANSSGQNASRPQYLNAQSGSFVNHYRGSNNYRGGNNYRNNNGFRGRGYNSGNSGGSRQSGNGNNNWGNYAYQGQPPPPSLSAMNAQQTSSFLPQDAWIVDSGASHHITSDISALSQVIPFEGSEKITIGNGTGLPIKNIGSIMLQTPTCSLVLNKVLHVPNIARSLLSVKQLCADNKSWFICDDSEFFVQDKKTKEIVYHGKSRPEELLQIPVVTSAKGSQFITKYPAAYLGKAVKNTVWHQRLGHPAHDVMTTMLKQSNIPVQTDDNNSTCISCIQGKMSRIPFPVRTDRCTSPFQKVHTDIWGPSPVRSIEGYRYYVTFVDEYTRFVWIFPMSNKSDVFTIFVKFYKFVLNQFGATIKSLQTDGGWEYTSKGFTSFLADKVMCAFLGYSQGYKGVICYNLQTKKFILSRHVCFDESLFPAKMAQHTRPARLDRHEEQEQPRDAPVMVSIPVSHARRPTDHAGSQSSVSHSNTEIFSPNINTSEDHVSTESDNQGSGTPDAHSSPPNTTPLLPVIDPAQLQVVLPFTLPSHHTTSVITDVNPSCIQTRLKTGAIVKKSYVGCLVFLPQLHSLNLDGSLSADFSTNFSAHLSGGFSFLADITDGEEPRNFKAASLKPEWQLAMQEEFNALKTQGTISYGLQYTKSKDFNITAYSDSDWATDINTRRSITGFVVYLGTNPISWQSKKQSTVSRSSTEAEYKALAHCAADVFWIRSVFKDIHQSISAPPSLYCDNLSALALSSNSVFHSKIKHLDTDYHFVREKVQRGDLMVHYIPTEDQVADVFTKGLHSPIFQKHCRILGLSVGSAANSASVAQLGLRGE